MSLKAMQADMGFFKIFLEEWIAEEHKRISEFEQSAEDVEHAWRHALWCLDVMFVPFDEYFDENVSESAEEGDDELIEWVEKTFNSAFKRVLPHLAHCLDDTVDA